MFGEEKVLLQISHLKSAAVLELVLGFSNSGLGIKYVRDTGDRRWEGD